jgi:Gram-negative porin
MTAGGYVERGSIDVDLLGADAAVTSYGLTFGYETDRLDAEVFLGKSNTSPSLPAGVDVKDYGVRVGYQISPKAFVVGSLARTDISGVGGGVDLDMISLGGGYAFNDEFSVFGGVQRISLDIASADATTYGLGVAYQPARMNTVPMIFSLELARTSLDIGGPSADLNTVRLGVSIPLGNTSKGVPVNSLVNNIAKGGRSVVTSGIMGVF